MADGTNILDRLIGEKGIKTDITVRLAKSDFYNLGGVIVVSGVIVITLFFIIRYMTKL